MTDEIVSLSLPHCHEVARLHLDHLRTRFRGLAGQRLLEVYYRSLVNCSGASGFVAQGTECVLGFACGVWNARAVRSAMARRWPTLLFWATLQGLTHPHVAFGLLGRLINRDGDLLPSGQGYELRPIVVDAGVRRKGIGAQLVHAVLQDAGRRGYESVYLYTEEDNATSHGFYGKMNFHLAGKYAAAGAQYRRYERQVPPT